MSHLTSLELSAVILQISLFLVGAKFGKAGIWLLCLCFSLSAVYFAVVMHFDFMFLPIIIGFLIIDFVLFAFKAIKGEWL